MAVLRIKSHDDESALFALKNGTRFVLDECDQGLLEGHYWVAHKRNDGATIIVGRPRGLPNRVIFLHRIVLGAPAGTIVDHRDGDTLNNRRANLRFCTPAQSAQNKRVRKNRSCEFKGVWKRKNRYRASIKSNGARFDLGYFATAIQAAQAYDAAARIHHGEFARLNFSAPSTTEAAA